MLPVAGLVGFCVVYALCFIIIVLYRLSDFGQKTGLKTAMGVPYNDYFNVSNWGILCIFALKCKMQLHYE